MNEFGFTGPLKDEMSDFILLKRSVGNKYEAEVGVLKRFDRYLTQNYPAITGLTKESVTGWCTKQPHEKPANQCSRASVIRQFAKYLDSTGQTTYILPEHSYPSGPQYVPHIYTHNELARFFAETDTCQVCTACPWRHLVMPVFFRLLFECGLRCSEARLLVVGDVDLDRGCLAIRESKNRNSRLVLVSASMRHRLRTYVHCRARPELRWQVRFGVFFNHDVFRHAFGPSVASTIRCPICLGHPGSVAQRLLS